MTEIPFYLGKKRGSSFYVSGQVDENLLRDGGERKVVAARGVDEVEDFVGRKWARHNALNAIARILHETLSASENDDISSYKTLSRFSL